MMIAAGEMKLYVALVEVRTAEEISAGAADQFAAAIFEPRGAGGAVDLVVFGGESALACSLELMFFAECGIRR
jgi:hypothetical protein